MGRIILSAGHDLRDPGAVALGTTEAKEMMLTRNEIIKEFESRGVEYLSVPDTLSLRDTIRWINANALPGDVAIDLHGNAFNGSARGAEIYYIHGNQTRKRDAERILNTLIQEVPELPKRRVRPDTHSQHLRGLAFCRQVSVASVLIELCFIDNPDDLKLLQTYRPRFAKGLAKGLITWSGQTPRNPEFPVINIRIKNYDYKEKAILVNGNAYIPADLVELLGINLAQAQDVRQIIYGNIVYIKAVDVQQFDICVKWDSETKTVILDLIPRTELENADQIMGLGNATEEQLKTFLEQHNPESLQQFPNLPKLYIEQATEEGINHDIAFCQMCLETNYLRFGGLIKAEQNNFCSLGAAETSIFGAAFADVETGIKAHIQHLKAYGSTDMIKNAPVVDPRFDLVPRGVASSIYDLGRRWNPDPEYGNKIMAILRSLYQVY